MSTAPISPRIAGCALVNDGRTPRNEWRPRPVSGPGAAACKCGAESPVLPDRAARQQWHRSHKAAVLAARKVASC